MAYKSLFISVCYYIPDFVVPEMFAFCWNQIAFVAYMFTRIRMRVWLFLEPWWHPWNRYIQPMRMSHRAETAQAWWVSYEMKSLPYRHSTSLRYISRGSSYLFTRLGRVPAVPGCLTVNHYPVPNAVPWPVRFVLLVWFESCFYECACLI